MRGDYNKTITISYTFPSLLQAMSLTSQPNRSHQLAPETLTPPVWVRSKSRDPAGGARIHTSVTLPAAKTLRFNLITHCE